MPPLPHLRNRNCQFLLVGCWEDQWVPATSPLSVLSGRILSPASPPGCHLVTVWAGRDLLPWNAPVRSEGSEVVTEARVLLRGSGAGRENTCVRVSKRSSVNAVGGKRAG